jgi:hypothetical protein
LKIVWHVTRVGVDDIDDKVTFMVMDSNIKREFYLFGKMKKVPTTTEAPATLVQ